MYFLGGLCVMMGFGFLIFCGYACFSLDKEKKQNKEKIKRGYREVNKENYRKCPFIQLHIMCHGETLENYNCPCLYDRDGYSEKSMKKTFGGDCPFYKKDNDTCILIDLLKKKK